MSAPRGPVHLHLSWHSCGGTAAAAPKSKGGGDTHRALRSRAADCCLGGRQVLKVFLIRRDSEADRLDFGTVVCLDAEGRSVAREEVATVSGGVTDPEQLVLRIR